MQRDYNNQYSSLYGQYENRQNEINATDERGNFRIDDETERNALLEQARQEHLAKMYVMEADYATKVTDLDKQGIISSEDGLKILNIADLELKNSKLREILKNKGYDGIVYNNEIEAISFLMTNKFLGRTQIQIK